MSQLEERQMLDRTEDSFRLVSTLQVHASVYCLGNAAGSNAYRLF